MNNSGINREEYVLDLLKKSTGIEYSAEQEKVLRSHGSMRIISCAGSGKTTTITHMIAKRILTGEIANTSKVLCSTFSKVGALEIESRLSILLRTMGYNGTVKVQTLHAMFLAVIKKFGMRGTLISSSETNRILRDLCTQNDMRTMSIEDIESLKNMISYQVNNIMNCEQLMKSTANTFDNMSVGVYTAIYKGYASEKRKRGLIDFDDMQYTLYSWLVEFKKSSDKKFVDLAKIVRDYCKSLYDYFYIDEAQDVSLIQFEILKEIVGVEVSSIVDGKEHKYWKLDKELICIGDDDQAIYSWRGASPEILLDRVTTTFDMQTMVLPTNYRCGDKIVKFAGDSVRNNFNRFPKDMRAYKSGGNIRIYVVENDLMDMTKKAYDLIMDKVNSGVSIEDIAILSRNNNHLAILHNMLIRKGIYSEVSKDMKFTSGYIYKIMKTLVHIVVGRVTDSELSDILWQMVPYLGKKKANSLIKLKGSLGLDLYNFLGWFFKYVVNLGIDYKFEGNNVPSANLANSCMTSLGAISLEQKCAFSDIFSALKAQVDGKMGDEDVFIRLFKIMMSSSGDRFKDPDKQRSLFGMSSYFKILIKEYSIYGLLNNLRMWEQLDNGNTIIPGARINMSTIHGAKGCEWDNVILFGCDVMAMPSRHSVDILESRGIDDLAMNRYLDEERRLYYVACTRAKSNLDIISGDSVSPFLAESLGVLTSNSDSDENKDGYSDAVGNNSKIVRMYNREYRMYDEICKATKEKIKEMWI